MKKLNESHRESLLKYLSKEAGINTFIIGDVINFGFDTDFQELWAEFDENDNYKAVLLRYRNHFIVYAYDKYDTEAIIRVLNKFDVGDLSGKDELIKEIQSRYFSGNKLTSRYFCELKEKNFKPINNFEVNVEKARFEDAEDIFQLREKIIEFSKTTAENIRKTLESGAGRMFLVKQDEKVVAAAGTDAETDSSAMVVSVCTNPQYRTKGFASICVSQLCEETLKEGKTLYLFYDNPKAGNIYKRIGFRDIGIWTTVSFK